MHETFFFLPTTPYIGLALACFISSGCVGNSLKSSSLDTHHAQHGIASWYGPSFHGKPSASGEPYDMWALTAAHRTLPFGTWVRVRKISTGKTVIVRINDRGPFIKGRIIDLSYAGARELAMIAEGTAEVILTILTPQKTSVVAQNTQKIFWVQAGSFTTLREAMTRRERLAKEYSPVLVKTVKLASGERHHVHIGTFAFKTAAEAVARRLKKSFGIDAQLRSSN